MQFTAIQIAAIISGKIEGDESVTVNNFGKIEEAKLNELSFFANPKYEDFLYSSKASIIIVNDTLVLKDKVAATLIRVKDAYSAFAILLQAYQNIQNQMLSGIEPQSYIDKDTQLGTGIYVAAFAYLSKGVVVGNNTKIMPHVYIGNGVIIGENCIINAGVKIYHGCKIGNNVTIHAGSVIGSDGFGFAPQAEGAYIKVPQIGNVIIGNNVEIGANTTVDRATIGSTIIKNGVKLDNLLQVGHNVEIGENTVIAALTGISGSAKIGDNVMIGGQVGIVGHIQIGNNVKINAKSGVSKNLVDGRSVTGVPATDFTAHMRSQAMVKTLPELEKRIKALEQKDK